MPIQGDLQTKTEHQDYDQLRERLSKAAMSTFDLYALAEKAIWRLNEGYQTLLKDREYNLQRITELEEQVKKLKQFNG